MTTATGALSNDVELADIEKENVSIILFILMILLLKIFVC
jgi:hypothetical protein